MCSNFNLFDHAILNLPGAGFGMAGALDILVIVHHRQGKYSRSKSVLTSCSPMLICTFFIVRKDVEKKACTIYRRYYATSVQQALDGVVNKGEWLDPWPPAKDIFNIM